MTANKRIHLIYRIVLSVALIFAGICLMAACLNIYRSGDRPYSPEAVATQFAGIAIPVYIALALTVGSFILHLVLPAEQSKRKPDRNYRMILQNLWQKRDLAAAPLPTQEAIRKLQKARHTNFLISLLLLGAFSIAFLFYGTNPKNFSGSDINGSVMRATAYLLGCLAIPAGYALYTAYSSKKSMLLEIDLVKTIAPDPAKVQTVPRDYTNIARWLILGLAIAIMAYGYCIGGTLEVLTKAANICTECVGLG